MSRYHPREPREPEGEPTLADIIGSIADGIIEEAKHLQNQVGWREPGPNLGEYTRN